MTAFRRLASVFAVALAVLVTVQTVDLVACADETEQGGGKGHTDDGQTAPDCLCHITFTRTGALPAVAAGSETLPPAYAPFVTQPASADGPTVEHVPLA